MASLSLLLSQAMPLYLNKTEFKKYFQEFSRGGPDLEIPTGSEAWSPRRVSEAVRSWCLFACKFVTETGTTCRFSHSFQTPSLPKLSQGLLPNTSLTRSCFLSLQDILSHVINTEPHISCA